MQQYCPATKNDAAVVGRLKELASENRRYGYLRLHAMLRREGLVANRKRTYRLYTEQGLQVRTKKRRKLPRRDRIAPQQRVQPEIAVAAVLRGQLLQAHHHHRIVL